LGSPVEIVDLSKNFSWISPHHARTNKKAINKIQESYDGARSLLHRPPCRHPRWLLQIISGYHHLANTNDDNGQMQQVRRFELTY
jgi:hypothetical protein